MPDVISCEAAGTVKSFGLAFTVNFAGNCRKIRFILCSSEKFIHKKPADTSSAEFRQNLHPFDNKLPCFAVTISHCTTNAFSAFFFHCNKPKIPVINRRFNKFFNSRRIAFLIIIRSVY